MNQKNFIKIFSIFGPTTRRRRRDVNDVTSMPTKNCQCWHHWTLPSEEGHELLRSGTSSRSNPTSTSTISWPKPIATSTWLGHLILCILWTCRWSLPTGSSVGAQWTSYIQQDCEMEPVLQLTFWGCLVRGPGACPLCHHSGSGGGCCKLEPLWAYSEWVIFFQSVSLLNYSPTDKD